MLASSLSFLNKNLILLGYPDSLLCYYWDIQTHCSVIIGICRECVVVVLAVSVVGHITGADPSYSRNVFTYARSVAFQFSPWAYNRNQCLWYFFPISLKL